MRHQVSAVAAAATVLAACGAGTPAAPHTFGASPAPASVAGLPRPTPPATSASNGAATSSAAAAADLRNMGFDFSHPIHMPGNDCVMPTWGGRPSLQQVLDRQPNLATAAVMTVVGPTGPARWNTPDGHRWTQPEAIAARLKGVAPAIQQPWRLDRSGPTFAGDVPDSVEVWLVGGRVGDDYMFGGNCIAGEADPVPGRSYLIFFGPAQDLAPPGAYRVILAAWPYDPVTHALDGPWGRMWLSPAPASGSRTA